MNSDIWIDIKPKADLVLMYTLANVLIEKGYIDKNYIENYTEGYEEFKKHVAKFTLENVCLLYTSQDELLKGLKQR